MRPARQGVQRQAWRHGSKADTACPAEAGAHLIWRQVKLGDDLRQAVALEEVERRCEPLIGAQARHCVAQKRACLLIIRREAFAEEGQGGGRFLEGIALPQSHFCLQSEPAGGGLHARAGGHVLGRFVEEPCLQGLRRGRLGRQKALHEVLNDLFLGHLRG